jgi:hypothetical protein
VLLRLTPEQIHRKNCTFASCLGGGHSAREQSIPPSATRMIPAMERTKWEAVAWIGRWKFLEGWTKVWSCERHADELIGARR